MPRTIDLIRANKMPSNMMQFAAKGALSVPADENIEILVYLAKHNKIFSDLARMTLAGWDEKASLAAASDPKTPREVLAYLISPENIRPALLPALLENPSVQESEIGKFAISASAESIAMMLASPRIRGCRPVLEVLKSNPYLRGTEASDVTTLLGGATGPVASSIPDAELAQHSAPECAARAEGSGTSGEDAVAGDNPEQVPDEEISAYLAEHAQEIVAEQSKPFQPVGGIADVLREDFSATSENKEMPATVTSVASGGSAAAVAPAKSPAPAAKPQVHGESKRVNTVQKINGLDVKGRIQLALKGNKEERSILIRDGTKVVALAVLEAPKLSDGEVEKFALQKNVLEAVLRQIPLKRRFMKNYVVVRNLVSNPRTPLDLGLGLMKHLLVQDLKNISANKEVSETVRKLALKMYKQKLDVANKK
jgi:hypothetical protein